MTLGNTLCNGWKPRIVVRTLGKGLLFVFTHWEYLYSSGETQEIPSLWPVSMVVICPSAGGVQSLESGPGKRSVPWLCRPSMHGLGPSTLPALSIPCLQSLVVELKRIKTSISTTCEDQHRLLGKPRCGVCHPPVSFLVLLRTRNNRTEIKTQEAHPSGLREPGEPQGGPHSPAGLTSASLDIFSAEEGISQIPDLGRSGILALPEKGSPAPLAGNGRLQEEQLLGSLVTIVVSKNITAEKQ